MFDRIVFISDHGATVKLKNSENLTMNLMNLHLVFEDDKKKVLGEINDINGDTLNANFLGEIVGNRFLGGTIRKPRLDAKIRVINAEEIHMITGRDENGYMRLGSTPFYEGASVFLDVNSFFSSHFAIMGNSGSGKSCGISRLFQNMFHDKRLNPANANIVMLDSSGEYYNAFNNLNSIDPRFHYRFISTNEKAPGSEKLRIPVYLLNVDDLALLLQVTTHSQLPIVERMRKLALVFSQKDMDANNYKNHLIAKAIMTILYTNETAPNKRNEVFSVLASCSTPQFNLEAVVQGIGYTRKFRECFLIDNSGNFTESVLLTEYITSFIDDDLDAYEPREGAFYTLDTLEKALQFTLISEGWLRNKNTYGDAVTLKVRLHSLIVSQNASFFDVKEFMTVEEFLRNLMYKDGSKCQFVNINLDDVDDSFAKVITKIYSRLIFDYSKGLKERASNPYHIIVEEAHRYIQNDNDRFLLGYNIFERVAKEGRKYGVILGIITQRPVELSDTVISQCSNFLIFKMNHPVDVEYIRKMVPNISDEIVEKQKTLQAGTCLGFGSAFRIPMIVKMDMPNPTPWSGNCDVVAFWSGGASSAAVNPAPISNTSSFESINLSIASSDVPSESRIPSVPSGFIDGDLEEFAPTALSTDTTPEVTTVAIPVTDTGVSLISLSSDNPSDNSTNNNNSVNINANTNTDSNVTLELPKTPPVNNSVVNIPSMNSVPQEPPGMTMSQPLINFTEPNNNSSNVDNNVGVNETVRENTFINLNDNNTFDNNSSIVSFNNSPQMTGVSGSNSNTFTGASSAISSISNEPSNVSSAPNVNKTGFITKPMDEEIIDGATTSGNNDSAAQVPGLQLVNMLGGPTMNNNVSSNNNGGDDTFGKPELSMMSNFNNNSNVGNNMIPSIPSNLNMSNDSNNNVSIEPNGNALVNFIENM